MQPPEAIVVVYRSNRRECARYGLVLEAVGINYAIRDEDGACTLVVHAESAARARAEIEAYQRENPALERSFATSDGMDSSTGAPLAGGPSAGSPSAGALSTGDLFNRDSGIPFPSRPGGSNTVSIGGGLSTTPTASGWPGVCGYICVLLIAGILQQHMGAEWFEAGMSHAGRIRSGEWWRTVTALTLHSDVAHLSANAVIGGLFGLFAGQIFGNGLAWLSIVIAGTAGNLLNAFVRDPGHTSIGASTAVFAALGLVAAHSWILQRHRDQSRLARFAPIIGAAVLLSFLGTSGERTDVLAHVTGFFAGLLLGAAFGLLGRRVAFGRGAQTSMGMTAIVVLVVAWFVGFRSA
jgi:membrane associated rhomboid family serine protease